MDAWNISSIFIHSYILMSCLDEDEQLDGVYVTSERFKNKHLLYLETDTICDIFTAFGEDYPTQFKWTDLPDGQERFLGE
ncbi:hypothetical protein A3709_16760 [Halioglobus sp. HI00S01]|uniref:hypothetical protein n=1 Tax=Halioglobus sp. HI00S01 TaxID=1822214 RepID=UPI0007C24855|nr:hypothetical protein [Halioglobus sp. HI00S01]KZX59193.1 hypothetical protein A3709_16760 [Halioglobus sp. HI00S01]